jgi:hypothetical protein
MIAAVKIKKWKMKYCSDTERFLNSNEEKRHQRKQKDKVLENYG